MSVHEQPEHVTLVAEGGLNHAGSLAVALRLVEAAAHAGADYIKWQKRTPELCVPREMWDVPKETPFGVLPYIDYRERMEFGAAEYQQIDSACAEHGIGWFMSVWDVPSLEFALQWDPPFVKVPSALLVNDELVAAAASSGVPLILSTGMSTAEQIEHAVQQAYQATELWLLHCHSAYPAPTRELNLRCIPALSARYPHAHIGYSGHEIGIATTTWAVVLGARMVERHLTVDRTMWGSDQLASLEPLAFERLVRHVRSAERAVGDGVKRVFESERSAMLRLRPETTQEPVTAGGSNG